MAKSRATYRYLAGTALIFFLAGYAVFFFTGVSTIRHLLDNLVAGYLIAWGLYAMLSKVSRAELVKRFILTSCTIIACFVIAEGSVLLGAVDYRLVFGTSDLNHPLGVAGRRFDPELLWMREPYYRFEADYQGNLGRGWCIPPDPSRRIRVQYDRNGFRNDRDMSEADIVVIGDSYVEAPMTPSDELSTSILARLQDKAVVNLGYSGYGPPQELLVLQRFGLPLNPKAVIWVFFEGNDISDMRAYEKNMASLSGQNAYWYDFWFRSLSRNLLALYFRSSSQRCVPSSRTQPYWATFTDHAKAVNQVFFAPPDDVDSFPSNTELGQAASYIAQAAKVCRERNITFIAVFAPDKYRVYSRLSNVALSTEKIRSWELDDFPARLGRMLIEMVPDIQYVDLTPALMAESRRGFPTYLHDDTHWSLEGHRIAAEGMHRALQSAAWPRGLQKAQR